jgi:hypothetical protein
MIQDIYFSIGLISFLSIFYQLKNFNKIYFIYEWFHKFNKITNKKPKKIDFRTKYEWDTYNKVNIFIFFDTFWIFGLIFTSQYYLPIFYFLITFIFKSTIFKNRWTVIGKISTFFLIFLRMIICIFILYSEFFVEIISSFL